MSRALSGPMPVVQSLRVAAKRARDIAAHLDRAADEFGHDITSAALERTEQPACLAHEKTMRVREVAARALKVIASLREGLAA